MKEEINVLKKVEDLTSKANKVFGEKSRDVLSSYPLTFALLILFWVTMVTQGVKDLLLEINFFEDKPFTMLLVGLLVLAITGTLYKKLKK